MLCIMQNSLKFNNKFLYSALKLNSKMSGELSKDSSRYSSARNLSVFLSAFGYLEPGIIKSKTVGLYSLTN